MLQKFINNTQWAILLGVSQSVDIMHIRKLRRALWGKDLPCNLLKIIILGHTDSKLRARLHDQLGTFVNNNNGVFQGSPPCAQLFIIYTDCALEIYTHDITNAKVRTMQSNIRDDDPSNRWHNYVLKLKTKTPRINSKLDFRMYIFY